MSNDIRAWISADLRAVLYQGSTGVWTGQVLEKDLSTEGSTAFYTFLRLKDLVYEWVKKEKAFASLPKAASEFERRFLHEEAFNLSLEVPALTVNFAEERVSSSTAPIKPENLTTVPIWCEAESMNRRSMRKAAPSKIPWPIAWRIGTPLPIKVPKVRANLEIAAFLKTGPNTGIVSLK